MKNAHEMLDCELEEIHGGTWPIFIAGVAVAAAAYLATGIIENWETFKKGVVQGWNTY